MKREILYRGARMEDGKFVYGSLVFVKENDKSENELPHIVISYGPDTFDWFEVDPETVGQYTGVPDVNGKNIFEGDHDKDGNCVVFCERCNGWQFAQIDIPTKDICIPCHCCDGNFMFNDIINQFEITGNINDNKELLK